MNNYITGNMIKELRKQRDITQNQLAEKLCVSDKTISKWETGRGLPDISLIEPLAKALNISVMELINGDYIVNSNRSSNMMKTKLYVCPICGNVIQSIGEISVTCCGISLPVLEAEKMDQEHKIMIEEVEDEHYLTMDHPMSKDHHISFIAYASVDNFQLIKLYAEGNAETRIKLKKHGILYVYCNRDGLMSHRF